VLDSLLKEIRMQGLPLDQAPNRAKKRQKPGRQPTKISSIAHDLETKTRTEDVVTEDTRSKEFSALMLSEPVLKGLRESGFVHPSPIQLAALPNSKIGLDMIVQSKSGTGKTCVYVVTALEMIRAELPGLQVLVIAPTREIAMQGVEVASQIGSSLPEVKISSFIGGLPVSEDRVKAQHCHLAVGTPGRVKQILDEGILNPDTVRLVILDEADKLLEPSFLRDTTHILNLLPQNKQVLALSATYPDELSNLAEKFMRSPQHVRLGKENQVLHGVAQFVLELEHSPSNPRQNQIKQEALLKILSSVSYNQCLIFSNFQVIAQSSADFLNSRGFPSIFISAGQDQVRRIQAIQTFKTFKCRILCSTDLTARGIDAENVNLVINLDVPDDHNTYLHRIGRGGRFGSNSIAISLAPEGKSMTRLKKIVNLTDSVIRILPSILPKDIRKEELPVLEGLTESELKEAEEQVKIKEEEKEKREETKPSRETETSNPGQSENPKTGSKVKRRGNKHPSPSVPSNPEPELEKPDPLHLLTTMITSSHNPCKPIGSYEELEDIANNFNSSSLLKPDTESPGLSSEAKKGVCEHFSGIVKSRKDKFDNLISQCETNLNYRSIEDVLQQVRTEFKPEVVKDSLSGNMSGLQENISDKSSETSDSSSDSSDSESDSSDDEESSSDQSEPETPSRNLASNPGVNFSNVNLNPEQNLYLQSWMQTVERQRQLIQNREYRRVLEHYQRKN
jgi:superfamily II DNA/RNA helicase